MKHYETMFIVKPTLVEDEIKQRIGFFKDVISKNGGEIETCLDMGMRNLAYEIKKNQRGYYYVIYFRAEPKLIMELERLYRINEDILRFIVIKYESKKDQKAWQTLVDRANKKPEPKPAKKEKPQEVQAKNTESSKDIESDVEEGDVKPQEDRAQDV